MPPHPQHDAFVGPFHGWSLSRRVGKAQRAHRTDQQAQSRCAWWARRELRLCPPYAPVMREDNYALNQPTASPVKEKYSPAAVSAQETISMRAVELHAVVADHLRQRDHRQAPAPRPAPSAASSCAAARRARRNRPAAGSCRPPSRSPPLIICSVISAVGVRSWNATDSASSVSDRYSSTSNHSTFLGTFIETPVSPVISRLLPSYSLGNSSPISR